MAGWNVDTQARTIGIGAITIVEGASFCISGADGDMDSTRPHGVFFRDTRIVSSWRLRINGRPVEPLLATMPEPFRAVFTGRAIVDPQHPDSPLLVDRERRVGDGLREDLTLRNYSQQPIHCTVHLDFESDFADIFEVKEGRAHASHPQLRHRGDHHVLIETSDNGERRGIRLHSPQSKPTEVGLIFAVVVPARGEWTERITVTPTVGGTEVDVGFPAGLATEETTVERRFVEWEAHIPIPSLSDEALEDVLTTSQRDLGSLRIFDPDHPERAVVAAGAPWFMTLFGRDALLTSIMSLPVDPSLAVGTLETLAGLQGQRVDAMSEEQPGRILHEVRFGVDTKLALGGSNVYYGTADATPLFVVALGEMLRWGIDSNWIHRMTPHADRALAWIDEFGDVDGDGFVEYERLNPRGLINQGWKDSWDGITFRDGRLAEAPIALCEVQGYVYSAFVARALIARAHGDAELSMSWLTRARTLKKRFNETFWIDDHGYFAVALDRDKKPVDSCASNMGHLLWSGIVDDDKAAAVASRLLSPELFSGWGVRTLATDMAAYNPAGYHTGAVWPHDNALIVAGLMRYGFVEKASAVALGIFAAAREFDGRLPELFCGFDRTSYPVPVPYPTSCSPQAWAAATPYSLVRSLFRMDPCAPCGGLWIAPVFPIALGHVRIDNMPVAGARISIGVDDGVLTVTGLPEGIRVHRKPRPAHADADAGAAADLSAALAPASGEPFSFSAGDSESTR